jgi:trimeric autotransporter adhesin
MLVVALGGCGRFQFDAQADATLDDARDADAYRTAVLADAPLAYWRLGELTPTIARDELGQYDGSYEPGCTVGAPGALFGDANPAVHFDGTSCFITLPAAFEFLANSPYTVEAWVSPAVDGAYHHVFTKQTRIASGPPDDGYALLVSAAGVYAERVVGGTIIVTNPDTVTLNTFVHAVATYDGATLQFYVNGLVAAPGEPDARPLPALNVPAYIGSARPSSNLYEGSIDEIAIYASALPPSRIADHYNIGIRGF